MQTEIIANPNTLTPQALVTQALDTWHTHLYDRVNTGEMSIETARTYITGASNFLTFASARQANPGAKQTGRSVSLGSGVNKEIDKNFIRQWLAHQKSEGHKPNTINIRLSAMKNLCQYLVSEGYMASDPTVGVKGPKRKGTAKKHLRDALTDTEISTVLQTPNRSTPAGIRDYAVLVLKAYLGLRDIEVTRLTLADITTQGTVKVLMIHGKGQAQADEPMKIGATVEKALLDWLSVRPDTDSEDLFVGLGNRSQGQAIGSHQVRAIVRQAYKTAGITGNRKTSHSMRHSAISRVASEMGIEKAQQFARHASPITTQVYIHENGRFEDPPEDCIKW